MNITLFAKIVKKIGKTDIDEFEYIHNNKTYAFKDVSEGNWDDQGKYQYKTVKGQLIEMNEEYQEIQSFNFGISRSVQRNGSYFTDYNYDYEPYEMFEIKEILVPEVIIPAHMESKWNRLKIDLDKVVDEQEEERKRIEEKKIRLEEEVKAEKERLIKLYPMNRTEIIKMVNKNLKKKIEKFTIYDMRKEYFNIVIKKKIENQNWIDYYKEILEKEKINYER